MKLNKLAMAMALAMSALTAKADISDGQFSTNQIFDVQYYWSGTTLNASNFIAPYDMNFQHPTVGAGQYFKFFPSTTNPGTYGLGLYNSNGTLAQVVHNTGTLQAIGPDALFYIGSGFFGTVITTSAGYSYGQSASFTSMDTSVSASDMSGYTWASTTPLSAGQTASSTPSTPAPSGPNYVAVTQPTVTSVTPTSTNSPPGETAENAIDGNPSTKYLNFDRANAGFTIKLQSAQVLQGIKFTTANDFPDRDPSKYSLYGSNDGVNWTTIVNAASITLSNSRYTQSSMYTITNTNPYFYYFITFPDIKASASYADINACGLACDSVQIGDVEFIYDTNFAFTAPTDTGTGTIANPGTAGSVSDMAVPVVGPQAVTVASGSTGTNASGSTTLSVTNAGTYTNDGTNGDVTNSGTFTNNGTTGAVTNTGTFNNNGTTGNVSNSGTFNNDGTTGTVTNHGTFNNGVTGTTGAVSNHGTFNNSGSVTTFENAGTLTNNASGTIGTLSYNNHIVNNNGTINTITYNGGTVNNHGTIGSINNSEAHGTFHNDGTVTGNVTTNSTFNNNATGVVQGTYANTGTLNNAGTVGAVSNDGTFNNSGTAGAVTLVSGSFTNTGTAASVDNTAGLTFTNGGAITGALTNAGTVTNNGNVGSVNNTGWFTNAVNAIVGFVANSLNFTNNGTAGDVTNTGTMTNGGTAGVITNSGTLTQTGGTASVNNTGTFTMTGGTLGSYTQTAPGITVMSVNRPILVTGAASLGGGISINDVPTGYGKYTVLTAGSVNGTYDSINSTSNYLRYSLTDVKLYVTPDASATQSSINATSSNLANAFNLQSNIVTTALGSDCAVFGATGACVGVNLGMNKASSGDLFNGGVTVAKKINDNWRVGVVTNAPFNNPTIGNVGQSSDPAYGLFATWTKERLSVQGSAAFNQGTMTITRNGPETGVGKMAVDNKAYQLKASYVVPVNETVSVTPYIGVRYVESNYGGYTEQGPVFPLTVNSTTRNATSAIAGVSVAKQLTEKLSGNVAVGITQNLTGQSATFNGTSEIGGLTTFTNSIPSNGNANPSVSAGVSYSIDKTTKVGANVGWQAKGSNANIGSIGISLTKGF